MKQGTWAERSARLFSLGGGLVWILHQGDRSLENARQMRTLPLALRYGPYLFMQARLGEAMPYAPA